MEFRTGDGAGFTVVEILVTLVLLLTLAALLTPNISGVRDHARVDAGARTLQDLADAIHRPDSAAGSFRQDIGRYPGALTHLTREIADGEDNSCGRPYRPGDIIPEKWQGPYFSRLIEPGGFPIEIGFVENGLVREHDHRTRNSTLRIIVTGVFVSDAVALDEKVDLGDGSETGTVRWGGSDPEGFVTLEYVINVAGC